MNSTVTDFRTLTRTERKTLLRNNRGLLARAREAANVTRGHEFSRGHESRVYWGSVTNSPIMVAAINAEIAKASGETTLEE